MRRIAPVLLVFSGLLGALPGAAVRAQSGAPDTPACPADMVRVGRFCIDRYEMATVDHRSGQPLSPFYPPHARLIDHILFAWSAERRNVGEPRAREMPLPELPLVQRARRDYQPRAVSQRGVLPQAYLSQPLAKLACENAGKRLCTEVEWMTACRGQQRRKFPYGDRYEQGRCNVYGYLHPALVLHGASSYGHRDPRLNLVEEADGTPLLRRTGAMPACASEWNGDRIYDLVGNIDEWVEAEKGAFLGGFYARSTREGCEARVGSHPPPYYDYSTGARCCRAVEASSR